MNRTLLLTNILIATVGITCTWILMQMGHPAMAFAFLALSSVTLLIFSHPKFYLARFLYPGLVTFFFLMVIPIVSTVLISASNLSTGHFMSADKARELILQEKYLDQDAPVLDFELYRANKSGQYILRSGGYAVTLPKKQTNQPLVFAYPSIELDFNQLQSVKKNEVIDFFENNPTLQILHPDYEGFTFSFFRSDQLAALQPSFLLEDEQNLRDQRTAQLYTLNKEAGRFSSADGHFLNPGFVTWVGLENYLILIKNKDLRVSFLKVFFWTLVWGFFSVFLSFSLGISLAILLNDKTLKLKGLYRGLLILPYSIPFFISVLIFKGMLNQDFGLINQILSIFSIGPIPWLHDGLWAKAACLMVNLWLGFPYMFLVTTGILQSIPESIYEAAKLDGAGPWARFKCLTLPLVMSAVGPLLIGSFAFNINNFVGIYLLTGGGPPMAGAKTQVGQTDILISYTYRLAFEGGQGQDFGLASSIAVIIFFIVATLTMLNFKLFKARENHG